MAVHRQESSIGRAAWIFTTAFVLIVVVLGLLGHYGLPDRIVEILLGATMLVIFAVAGIAGGTMDTSAFHVASRSVPAVWNGVAGAAAFLSAGAFIGLAGAFFATPDTAVVFGIGWSLGFLILAVAIAPYVRKSGAYGATDFLALRYGGATVRLVGAVIVSVALFAALAAALGASAAIASGLFGISARTALGLVVALVLAATLLGGMRALTLTNVFQYIVLALAFLAPAVIISAAAYTVPIPQLTFGAALEQAANLIPVTGELRTPEPSRLLPLAPAGGFQFFAAIVALATGAAALPHILMRSGTVPHVDAARRSVGWTLVFVLIVGLTAPAVAAYARLAILGDLAGATLSSLPDAVFEYGEVGLAEVCGVEASSPAAVRQVCSEAVGSLDGPVAPHVTVDADAIVLALPQIAGLPHALSALITVGALSAALAAAAAIAFGIAAAIGHDLYGRVLARRASAGRRLIVTRLLLIVVTIAGAWLAASQPDDVAWFALAAFTLSAGGLFPALFLAVWWTRANAAGAIAGMALGTVVTAALVFGARYPGLLPVGLPGEGSADMSPLTAAIVGLPVGFAAVIAVSLVTPPPSEERREILDAIRRPGGAPFVHSGDV